MIGRASLPLVVILACLAYHCASAGTTDMVRLAVVDAAGHYPLPGIEVVLTNSRLNNSITGTTDAKGQVAFPNLPKGDYQIAIPIFQSVDNLSSNTLSYRGGAIDLRIKADLTTDRKGWYIALQDDPTLRPLTKTLPPDLVILFRDGTTNRQINTFLENSISVPDPSGGFAHRPGVGGIRMTRVGAHEGYVVSWNRDATPAQRQDVRRRVDSDPVVCKVLENIEPSSINPAEVACP